MTASPEHTLLLKAVPSPRCCLPEGSNMGGCSLLSWLLLPRAPLAALVVKRMYGFSFRFTLCI